MTKKLNKFTWMAILGFALVGLYVTFVQGQSEAPAPNMVPYMLKELSSLTEQKKDLEEKIASKEEDLAALKGLRGRLDALTYPDSIKTSLETLSSQPASEDALMRVEDIARSFHDPFLNLLVSSPSANIGSGLSDVYLEVEGKVLAHEDDVMGPIFAVRSDVALVKNPQDKAKIYQDFLARVTKSLSAETFGSLKKKCLDITDTAIQGSSRAHANDKKELTQLTKQVNELGNSLQVSQQKQEKKQDLDEALFRWGLPVIIIFILLLTVINIIPRVVAIITKNNELAHEDNENEVLHTVTVFLLIISVLILGIRGQIDNASLSTLLAGISGYVLGGQMKKRQQDAAMGSRTP